MKSFTVQAPLVDPLGLAYVVEAAAALSVSRALLLCRVAPEAFDSCVTSPIFYNASQRGQSIILN